MVGAMSVTSPTRPSGISAIAASENAGEAEDIRGVSMSPGITALTRMPRVVPSSREAVRVRPRRAHFEEVYAAAAWPATAATEQMFTIEEPAGISGTSAWMPSSGPVTLMSKVLCHWSIETFGSRSRAATPALLTSASTRPCSADSQAASSAQSDSEVTSRWRSTIGMSHPAPSASRSKSRTSVAIPWRPRPPARGLLGALAAGRARDDDDLAALVHFRSALSLRGLDDGSRRRSLALAARPPSLALAARPPRQAGRRRRPCRGR